MTERFKKAYDRLVKAYFEGTLQAGKCEYCAIGNILQNTGWVWLFATSVDGRSIFTTPHILMHKYKLDTPGNIKLLAEVYGAVAAIKESGYSQLELAQVESLFEKITKIKPKQIPQFTEQQLLEDQYNGLKAIVELLMSFDNMVEQPVEYTSKFREHPKLVTV